ncbi:MAG: Uma2 family endonuclease [Longimicrobiaceae bacterium]
MATRPDTATFVTPEEYLAYDWESDSRNEYLDGRIIEITATSPRHSLILANLTGSLVSQLRDEGCRVYCPGLRVAAARPRRETNYFSPDLVVQCGELQTDADRQGLRMLNPAVIVEVLSPSTADYDRGTKWEHYRNIASLQDYLLVAQAEPRIERYTRHGERFWLFNELTELEDVVQLDSIGCTLALRDVYENAFDAPAETGTQTETDHG